MKNSYINFVLSFYFVISLPRMNVSMPIDHLTDLLGEIDRLSPGVAAWIKASVHRWLDADAESETAQSLNGLGLTGNHRQIVRKRIRDFYIRAAFEKAPGESFAQKLQILENSINRIARIREGYRYASTPHTEVCDALKIAAHWGRLPKERQLRNLLQEGGIANSAPWQLQLIGLIINHRND
jgi:hypothetical protein